MIGRFYGLSAVTLTLSPIGVGSYRELTSLLDSSTNKLIISVLKRDLDELIKFLESLPTVYEDAECNRAATKLRLGRFRSEEEKEELENLIDGKPKVLSKMLGTEDGTLNKLSEPAYRIVQELLSNMDKIKFFRDNINYGEDNSGITVLGEKLYILRVQSRAVLNYRLARIYKSTKSKLTKAQFNSLKKDVEILESYLTDDETMYNFSELNIVSEELRNSVESMDSNYFNNRLGLNLTDEEYYSVTKELLSVGLVGFTTYNKELFSDFTKSVSFASSSDLKIYPNQALYQFTKDLREIIESLEFIERKVS